MKGIPAGRAFGARMGKKAPCASVATLGFEADLGAQPWRKERLPCVHDPISVASIRTENTVVVYQSDFSFPGFADFLQATNVRTTPEPEASTDVD
jgi:hypothetical protein